MITCELEGSQGTLTGRHTFKIKLRMCGGNENLEKGRGDNCNCA